MHSYEPTTAGMLCVYTHYKNGKYHKQNLSLTVITFAFA